MNRADLIQKALGVTDQCLQAKGYIAMIDVFIAIGKLGPKSAVGVPKNAE